MPQLESCEEIFYFDEIGKCKSPKFIHHTRVQALQIVYMLYWTMIHWSTRKLRAAEGLCHHMGNTFFCHSTDTKSECECQGYCPGDGNAK